MLTVEEALARVLERADPVDVEVVPTIEADGRVLGTDVVSTLNVPPLDNSQMDGYAVRTVDVPAAGTTLRVSQRIAAGHVGVALEPGTAARIFTGAPVPAGCDAIVMQESCTAAGRPGHAERSPAARRMDSAGRHRCRRRRHGGGSRIATAAAGSRADCLGRGGARHRPAQAHGRSVLHR